MADYNGWTNYETWCVALWIDNDEGLYNYVLDEAARDEDRFFGDFLAELVGEMKPDLGPSMFSDLLNAAISSVNWRELAEHYLDTVQEIPAE